MAAVLAAGAAGAPVRAQSGSLEYTVKAAYLYKFGPFVEWPPGAFGGGGPIGLCVVGADPFGRVLDEAVRGQTIGGRPLAVRRMSRIGSQSGCHIAYISGSDEQSAADALRSVQGAAVLTVTDARRTGETRGMIHFVVQNNRVRFHIDEAAAGRNGLGLSSKLLSLALSVRPRA